MTIQDIVDDMYKCNNLVISGKCSDTQLAQCELAALEINANYPLANLTVKKIHASDWSAEQDKIRKHIPDLPTGAQFDKPIVYQHCGFYVGYERFKEISQNIYGVKIVDENESICHQMADENVAEVVAQKIFEAKGAPLMDRITNAYPNWRAQKLQEIKEDFKIWMLEMDAETLRELIGDEIVQSNAGIDELREKFFALELKIDPGIQEEISEKHFLECKEYEEKLFTKSGVQAKLLIPKHSEDSLQSEDESQQNITQSKLSVKDCYYVGNCGGYSEPNELVHDETHHCLLLKDPICQHQFAVVPKSKSRMKTKFRYEGEKRVKSTTFDVATNKQFELSAKDWAAVSEAIEKTNGACTFQYCRSSKKQRRHLQSYPIVTPNWEDQFPFAAHFKHCNGEKISIPGLDCSHFIHKLTCEGLEHEGGENAPLRKKLEKTYRKILDEINLYRPQNFSLLFTKDWMCFVPISLPGAGSVNENQVVQDIQLRWSLWDRVPPVDASIFLGIVRMPKLPKQYPETSSLNMSEIVCTRAICEDIRENDPTYDEASKQLRLNLSVLEDPFVLMDLWGDMCEPDYGQPEGEWSDGADDGSEDEWDSGSDDEDGSGEYFD